MLSTPSRVDRAASATVTVLAASSVLPAAASVTERLIPFVVAVCSPAAEAMVAWWSLIRLTVS